MALSSISTAAPSVREDASFGGGCCKRLSNLMKKIRDLAVGFFQMLFCCRWRKAQGGASVAVPPIATPAIATPVLEKEKEAEPLVVPPLSLPQNPPPASATPPSLPENPSSARSFDASPQGPKVMANYIRTPSSPAFTVIPPEVETQEAPSDISPTHRREENKDSPQIVQGTLNTASRGKAPEASLLCALEAIHLLAVGEPSSRLIDSIIKNGNLYWIQLGRRPEAREINKRTLGFCSLGKAHEAAKVRVSGSNTTKIEGNITKTKSFKMQFESVLDYISSFAENSQTADKISAMLLKAGPESRLPQVFAIFSYATPTGDTTENKGQVAMTYFLFDPMGKEREGKRGPAYVQSFATKEELENYVHNEKLKIEQIPQGETYEYEIVPFRLDKIRQEESPL